MVTFEEIVELRRKNQGPIWLVWTLTSSGNVTLRAICTEAVIANVYRRYLIQNDNVTRAWVERSWKNHLFAANYFEANYIVPEEIEVR